mmetsp:Transcript_130/g.341  ORF Transcript_130/g.341 Transcript_130/m.341 type:complete len:217 (-) Transcript_130:24-674(-)|eukprot:CAMPEP_0119260382 /NCGR_PEP_ID=MMETSP1329-20130426/796_1 /TAXON_ID=114041 /ORGANISM="Genus nov. species nov., Strain RCC1024" /LENGTH=216 /DNA_ID=CAMNT_0007259805 /DNA_START=65 /DNA_END=715 /DNA_ORIENTATION=-
MAPLPSRTLLLVTAALLQQGAQALRPAQRLSRRPPTARKAVDLSPFEEEIIRAPDELLPLTLDNVETILDELRPYLISDGGNVSVDSIEGPVVKLQLEGACGTCPSSTMTMKMGLERRLKEAIPEIDEVIQVLPDAPDLSPEAVDEVLEGVRPFLSVAGGSVDLVSVDALSSLQPTVVLRLQGKSASLFSVKNEISQRIHRHFMSSGLRVEWEDES